MSVKGFGSPFSRDLRVSRTETGDFEKIPIHVFTIKKCCFQTFKAYRVCVSTSVND